MPARHRGDELRGATCIATGAARNLKFVIDIENLSSVKTLRRADGLAWETVLEPILRDSAWFKPEQLAYLPQIGRLVSVLLDEITRYQLPEFVIYRSAENRPLQSTPATDGPLKATPASFTSALVSHRAERLVQAAELTAGALGALENGALQLSAVATRALFELAVVCRDIHQPLLEPWRSVHGSISRVRAAANNDDFESFRILWDTRMASRFYDVRDGWPIAKNVLTKIDRLSQKVADARHVYDMLCDATHPNVEANATLWRTDYVSLGDHTAIKFAPGQSNSVVKDYIISAIRLSLLLIVNFVRDLWWVAADIANTCDMTPNNRTLLLGLPARNGRNELCSCGSGVLTRACTHPEPEGISAVELGFDVTE